MKTDRIAEVGIDQVGSLFLRPNEQSFPFIYRAGKEVGWNAEKQRLFSPKPREWSYVDWFQHIRAVVADEYRVQLNIDSETVWSGVAEALRVEIETSQSR
jgi:hypothetical protein